MKGKNIMLTKKMTYTDLNGVERTEEAMFGLRKSELLEMELSSYGGMTGMLQKIIEEKDQLKLVALFKKIIFKAYGEKSSDGRRFIKSEELSTAFSQTAMYDELYTELVTNTQAAIDFVIGIMPEEFTKDPQVKKEINAIRKINETADHPVISAV